MSERELRRAAVLAQVKSKAWTLVQAAERMDLSYRQAKRLWKRYLVNNLRESFDLPGTPIRLTLREKKNPYSKRK